MYKSRIMNHREWITENAKVAFKKGRLKSFNKFKEMYHSESSAS